MDCLRGYSNISLIWQSICLLDQAQGRLFSINDMVFYTCIYATLTYVHLLSQHHLVTNVFKGQLQDKQTSVKMFYIVSLQWLTLRKLPLPSPVAILYLHTNFILTVDTCCDLNKKRARVTKPATMIFLNWHSVRASCSSGKTTFYVQKTLWMTVFFSCE